MKPLRSTIWIFEDKWSDSRKNSKYLLPENVYTFFHVQKKLEIHDVLHIYNSKVVIKNGWKDKLDLDVVLFSTRQQGETLILWETRSFLMDSIPCYPASLSEMLSLWYSENGWDAFIVGWSLCSSRRWNSSVATFLTVKLSETGLNPPRSMNYLKFKGATC